MEGVPRMLWYVVTKYLSQFAHVDIRTCRSRLQYTYCTHTRAECGSLKDCTLCARLFAGPSASCGPVSFCQGHSLASEGERRGPRWRGGIRLHGAHQTLHAPHEADEDDHQANHNHDRLRLHHAQSDFHPADHNAEADHTEAADHNEEAADHHNKKTKDNDKKTANHDDEEADDHHRIPLSYTR